MERRLDKVVIVTGGAQGIGEATAWTLASDGATIVVADIEREKAENVADALRSAGHQALAIRLDVADRDSAHAMARRVIDTFGSIDALVNNGGLDAQYGRAEEINEEHWRRLIDIDLTGQWWCTQAVLPKMLEQRYGRIVYVSSSSVYVGGDQVSPAYCAAKSGLIGLTVGLSAQLEGQGILVNCLMPGPTGNTGTPMKPEDVEPYLSTHPLGFGGPQPIAESVAYLLHRSGDWISGAILNVSGGRLRGR